MAYQQIGPIPYNPNVRQVPHGGTPTVQGGNVTGYNYNPGGGFGGFLNAFNPLKYTKKIDPLYYISQQTKPEYAKYGAFATALLGGGLAASPYFAGGAGGFGAGASASTIDPFAANAGLGTSWAPIAGGAGASAIPAGGVSPTTIAPTVPGAQGGFYGPAGNWTAGTPAGDFGAVAGGGGFFSGIGGQTLINSGANLFAGFLQNLAIQKAQGASDAAIQKRIEQALAALAPEHIMALAQQFLPQMAANMNQAGQTAVQAVREQAARTGQLEGPRALSFEAGTRAKLASDVQQRAFEAAMNTAGGQASVISGAPYTPIQPQMGIADAILASVNQAYQNKFYQQAKQQAGTPWRYPYNPWTGQPSGWGA